MSSFRYRALAEDGRRVRGELDAADLVELEHRLRAQGLLLITGRPRRPGLLGAPRIPRRELITFCFHLEQLLEAGVPPFESLAALRDAQPWRCRRRPGQSPGPHAARSRWQRSVRRA